MKKIALTAQEFKIVADIMKKWPKTVVFGSRIKGTSRRFSDLDLCIKEPITDYEYESLQEAFEESDLPFRVDLVEYNKVDETFKAAIDRQGVPLFNYRESIRI